MADKAKSVCDLISRWARESPDHPAILSGSRTVSYRQLDDAASRIARILLDQRVRPNQLVPVLATRSCEMVASFLGVLKAGACYVPIDIEAWNEDHVVSTLERVSASVLINLSTSTYPEYNVIPLHEVHNAFGSGPHGNTETEDGLPQANIQPMDLAYTIFTSGTTSTPKGVMIPHSALLNYVQQGDEEAPFNSCPRPEDKSLLTFSPGFDACAGVVFSTLCHGAQLMVAGISEFESYAARATIIAVTPSMLSAIQDVEACSQLRLIIVGGEAPNQRLIQRWSAPGRALYNGYGPTETTISSLMGKIEPSKPITLGRPMKNSRVLLLNGDTESDFGEIGEICITGPGLALGYYEDEAQTKQKFITRNGERMYRTGDFARRTKHGLEFAGRADNIVKNRGFLLNIDSEVIPILLDADAHTATAFMHRDRLVAFATPEDLDVLALRQKLLNGHSNYQVPDQIRAIPSLPLTANGKVDNRALRRLLDKEASDSEDIEVSADGLRQDSKMRTLKMAISAATSLPQSKIIDDCGFLELGGNSLAALKVLSYLRKRNLKLRLKDLLDLPSLQAVCGTLQDEPIVTQPEQDSNETEGSGDENEKSLSTGPMTALQTKMIQASLRVPGANYLLLRIRIPHAGKSVSALNLKGLWHRVLSRHAIFRTNFLLRDELQKVEPDLYLDWSEEETSLEQRDEIVLARSLEIRDKILSSGDKSQVFTPVNMYRLITVDGVGSTLLASAHHAQADGWSLSIILNEVQEALLGELSPVEEPPQFLAIALAQKKQQTDPEGVSFWTDILKNHTALPSLSLPKPPPNQTPYEWTRSLKVDLNLSGLELGQAARALNVTPSALLYTAWGLVLSNYTSSDRVAFGVVFSGRNMMEVPAVERAVGPLLNTVPFPIEFGTGQTIQAVVSTINRSLLQMLEFQWCAAEALASMPGESINGTLQTLVVTEYDLPLTNDLMSWSIEREDLMEFGLTLLLEKKIGSNHDNFTNEQDQGLQARILFDSSRYAQSGITRLLNHFKNALVLLTKQQNTHMKDVRSQFMETEEKTNTFESAAARWPHLRAIESPNGNLSYREVDEFADRVAARLVQHVQIKARDDVVVGVLSDGSVHWIISILATLKAGLICCPLDTNLPPTRINTIIRESGASVFLAANRACQVIKAADHDTIIVDEFLQQSFDSPVSRLETTTRPKDSIYLVFTSGSTGIPKGVPLHNVTVLNAIGVPAARLFAEPGKRISQLSALGFDMVLIEIFGSLCYVATLVLKDSSNPFEHIKHVNAMVTTPSFLSALQPEEYPNLDTVLLAGEPVTQKIADTWSDKVQTLLNIYGPSECGCVSGTRLLPGAQVTIGRPLPGLKLYVLDHQKCLVPQGITGEIYISGGQVTQGYWGNTNELIAKSRFIPNPFSLEPSYDIMYRTGDLGFWDEEMNISYVGRVDNQVKVRGFRVELEEVENALIAAGEGNVRSAAAIAINENSNAGSENYGLRIVAFVVPASVDVAVLQTKLAVSLPSYSRPSQILAVSELPMTATFKLDREQLKTLALTTSPQQRLDEKAQPTGETDDLSPTEKVIAGAWKQVLGTNSGTHTISSDDDFLSLGGNSILAIKSARLVAGSIGHDVPIALLLRETILGRLARAIDQHNAHTTSSDATNGHSFTSYLSSVQEPASGNTKVGGVAEDPYDGQPLSHLESELFEAHTTSSARPAFNTTTKFAISGFINVKKLAEAFLALIQENPILRARYHTTSKGAPFRLISTECSPPQYFIGDDMSFEGLQTLINKPFDLANEQLIRVILWSPSGYEGRTECIIVTHHIITDKASLALMLEWTSRRYKKLAYGDSKSPNIDENRSHSIEGTYIDWARWLEQQRLRSAGSLQLHNETRIKFWKNHLQRAQQATLFPISVQTQHPVSHASTRTTSTIPPLDVGQGGSTQAHKYSQRLAVAATALSLYACLGPSEMILGVPYLNRDEPGTASMLGLFVDRLPIHILLNDTNLGNADALLNGVATEINLCIENQVPYAEIQAAIASEKSDRGSSGNLFNVMIVYDWQSDSLRHLFSLGREVRIDEASDVSNSTGSMYPLEISYLEKEDGSLDVEINFDAEIISPELMTAMQGFLPGAMQGLAWQQAPSSIISDYRMSGLPAKP
ncbi:hypothetical protein O1611_g4449 [Lasiodiplodia mahajangana]|uniref:Uncharacterized protein n=1 Tax=Lasiodiplodia mahajangana TaxID=1108764 RepID=A0ACC2JPA5_9PEZI|nr:hypothetical protein O1611_g4449 [Lasiodiplodia mahajangana]